MVYFILFSLVVSVFLYVLLGGADFGAGILELFPMRHNVAKGRKIISKSMGPVWEANHMWLVLAVVVLFVAYPLVYTRLCTYLHVPIFILLLGIVVRGCAFTFRHYDAFYDEFQNYYTWAFAISSLVATFFLGVILGSMTIGLHLSPTAMYRAPYYAQFIAPWFNWFCIVTGIFFCGLFALIAATYLMGETGDKHFKKIFLIRVYVASGVVIISGIAAVLIGEYSAQVQLFKNSLQHRICIGTSVLVVALFPLLWRMLQKNRVHLARVVLAVQVGLLILNWLLTQFPYIYKPITIHDVAPTATLQYLTVALIVGFVLVLPTFYYLLYLFKISNAKK